MRNKKSNVNKMTPRNPLEEHGKYWGLARVAMQIAEEESKQLDEIERLLDAGEQDAAIAAMRRFIGPKKRVKGAPNGTTGKKAIA